MAYLLGNIYTKNYWNRTTIVEIIVGGWVISFLRHSVYAIFPETWELERFQITKVTFKVTHGLWYWFHSIGHI